MKHAHVLFFVAAALGPTAFAQDQAAAARGLATWQQEYGPGWTVWWNSNLTPHAVFGPGAQVEGRPVRTLAAARAAVTALLRKHGAWLGVAPENLREVIATEGARVLWLQYQQTWQGVPVHEAFVDFRFNTGDGGLALVGSDAHRNLPDRVVPTLTAPASEARFRARYQGLQVQLPGQPELWFYPAADGSDRLAWKVSGEVPGIESHPSLFFDAHSGELLGSIENLHHCGPDITGNVLGNYSNGALPDIASNPPQLLPMPGVQVNVPGVGAAFTDANGFFSIPYAGSTPQNVTVTLTGGRYWTVADQGGNILTSTSAVLDPVNSNQIVLNPTPTAATTAQTNGARWAQAIHDYVKGIVPTMTQIDPVITVNVNLAQTCNAFFSGSTINFYSAGGGCNNTSYSSVVAHEYGHSIDSRLGGIRHSGMSEGIGDICSIYLLDDNVIGRFFLTGGGSVRDALNTYTWPIVTNNSQEVHLQGNVIMGFGYDLLRKCQALYGPQNGYAIAESMVFESLVGNAAYYPDAVLQMVIADDNDSNLNNGSPHIDAIHDAAVGRHFIRPVFQAIDIAHSPLPDTQQVYGSYMVTATPTAKVGAVTGMTLIYQVNGGAFVPVPMSSNGATFSAPIPAAGTSGIVRYRLTATNTSGNLRRLPGEAADWFVFAVGGKTVVHQNNFDAGAGGWVTRAVTGTNNWRLGAPRGMNYDPATAASGTSCYCTDGTTSDTYSNNATMQLDSPALNCTGRTGMRLRFKRWLTCDASDVASVQINGTVVWSSDRIADQEWTTQDLDISALADNQASVVVRFQLATNNTSAVGGWNVDDVLVYALGAPNCAVPAAYGTASACSGGPASLAASGGLAQIGNSAFGYTLSQGPVAAPVLWVLGYQAISVPTPNGDLLVDPIAFDVGATNGSGAATLPLPLPVDLSLVGGSLFTQALLFDTAATAGFCLTNGVQMTVCGY